MSLKLPIPLSARIDVLPVRGVKNLIHQLFEPLGYQVEAIQHPLDERFPEWGEGAYYSVTIRATITLANLLTHLFVLIPAFDNAKHYFVGDDEIEKLLAKGEGSRLIRVKATLVVQLHVRRLRLPSHSDLRLRHNGSGQLRITMF
jgi:hypothetical protein